MLRPRLSFGLAFLENVQDLKTEIPIEDNLRVLTGGLPVRYGDSIVCDNWSNNTSGGSIADRLVEALLDGQLFFIRTDDLDLGDWSFDYANRFLLIACHDYIGNFKWPRTRDFRLNAQRRLGVQRERQFRSLYEAGFLKSYLINVTGRIGGDLALSYLFTKAILARVDLVPLREAYDCLHEALDSRVVGSCENQTREVDEKAFKDIFKDLDAFLHSNDATAAQVFRLLGITAKEWFAYKSFQFTAEPLR